MAVSAKARTGSLVSQTVLSRDIGAQWKAMSLEQKQPWVQMAEEKKREHKVKYPNYKFTPVRRKVAVVKRTRTKKKSKVGRALPVQDPPFFPDLAASGSSFAPTPVPVGHTDGSQDVFPPSHTVPSYCPPVIITTPVSPPLSNQPVEPLGHVQSLQLETERDSQAPIEELCGIIPTDASLYSFQPHEATVPRTEPSVLLYPGGEADAPLCEDTEQLMEAIYPSSARYDFSEFQYVSSHTQLGFLH
jgi:hypothetical protein